MGLVLIALVFFGFAGNTITVTAAECPQGWTPSTVTNKCYFINDTLLLAYINAEDYCSTQGAGGHLVSIHNRFEQSVIDDMIGHAVNYKSGDFWIGLDSLRSATGNTLEFSWRDGTPLDFTNWATIPGNLNPHGSNCVKHHDGSNGLYGWGNFDGCESLSLSICEIMKN